MRYFEIHYPYISFIFSLFAVISTGTPATCSAVNPLTNASSNESTTSTMTSQTVRYIYAIRHAEREDNINRNWRPAPGDSHDNPPLSAKGRLQAEDLHTYFKSKDIDAIFVSPFDRALETASILIGDRDLRIFVEPGVCESLVLCDNPPGFRPIQELAKRFPKIDGTYRPIVSLPLPREPMNFSGCDERVAHTVAEIRDIYKGNVIIIGHDSSVASVIWNLVHQDVYPGQATITVFKDSGDKVEMTEKCSTKHLKPTNKTRFTG